MKPTHNPDPRQFFNWRDFDPKRVVGTTFEIELTTYFNHLDELLEHEGEVVVIKGSEILGYYPDKDTAIKHWTPIYLHECFLVKKIVELEPIHYL